MGYGKFYLVGVVFIISLSTITTDEKNNEIRGIAESYNVSTAFAELNNLLQCRHEEQFKNGFYCDGYYEVYKLYGSGYPGNFGVNIYERGFCPYIEWVDQGSWADCYDTSGNYGSVIVYLNYKSLITYPGGSIDVYSYTETDIYQTSCCGGYSY